MYVLGCVRMNVHIMMVKHSHSHARGYQVIKEPATIQATPSMIKVLVELRRQVRPCTEGIGDPNTY